MKRIIGKAIIGLALLTLAIPAQAKVTPYDGLSVPHAADISAPAPAASAALNERELFQAPVPTESELRAAPRCTVHSVVFEKTQLAQACH